MSLLRDKRRLLRCDRDPQTNPSIGLTELDLEFHALCKLDIIAVNGLLIALGVALEVRFNEEANVVSDLCELPLKNHMPFEDYWPPRCSMSF